MRGRNGVIGKAARGLCAVAFSVLTAMGAAAQPAHCGGDADCAALGIGFECAAQKTACATHPESSTCVERVCRRKPTAVKDEDRACKRDADCAVVVLEFHCMYCARPEDVEGGIVAGVNKRRARKYEVTPSQEQLHHCATAGACPQTGSVLPRCLQRRCAVQYVPKDQP